MRFCDFFLSYKIMLKETKDTIKFTQLPLYRRIAVVVALFFATASTVLIVFNINELGIGILLSSVALLMLFFVIDSRKENMKKMLDEHYKPNSKKRMDHLIDLLDEYGISPNDDKTIDLIIYEACIAQKENDPLGAVIKPTKALAAVIIPIIVYAAKKIADSFETTEMVVIIGGVAAVAIATYVCFVALGMLLKDLLYQDNRKYEELVYDLRQIKVFYSSEALK